MKRSSRPRGPIRLSKTLHHQLNLYALAASAAGVGMLAVVQPAEAKIVYTPTHKVIGGRGHPLGLTLDLNHDGVVDFGAVIGVFSNGSALYAYPYANGNRVWHTSKQYGWEWASALPAGVRIGPNGDPEKPPKGGVFMEGWACKTSSCHSSGNWLDVKTRYLGLSFLINGKTHYGWARLSASISRGHYGVRATLTGYAYETIANKAIITGKTKGKDVATVEAASLGHLARGVKAIPAWRQKE